MKPFQVESEVTVRRVHEVDAESHQDAWKRVRAGEATLMLTEDVDTRCSSIVEVKE